MCVCVCVCVVYACEHVLSNLTELRLTGNELPEPPTGVARFVTNYSTLHSHLYELVTEREEVDTKSYVAKVETMILKTVDVWCVDCSPSLSILSSPLPVLMHTHPGHFISFRFDFVHIIVTP